MSASEHKSVQIRQHTDKKILSKAQKQFNTLSKKIEQEKKLLQEWQTQIPVLQQKSSVEYTPLFEDYTRMQLELVKVLDSAYDDAFFKKTDKSKLSYLITELLEQLMPEYGEQLKDMFNKYHGADFEEEQELQNTLMQDMMKSMFKEAFNLDVPDDLDMQSPEQMQAFAENARQQIEEQERLAAEAKSKRKKTPKQLAKEAREQEERQNISQSIQEVYRKLVRTLHPDREPDPEERERKTAMMQRVNIAYDKKDLLKLLALQLEIEQIDQAHLDDIAEDRLKYFNKILAEQLDELKLEIAQITMPLKANLNIPPFAEIKPQQMLHQLHRDIADIKASILSLKQDMQLFQNNQQLKTWLKGFKIPKQSYYEDDLFW